MDVRLSLEEQALRDAAHHLVGRLGPRAVADLDDTERAAKLDAAVDGAGWRTLRDDDGEGDGQPAASAVAAAIVAEALGRGVADTPFLAPTLSAELRRVAGAPAAASAEAVLFDATLAELAVAAHGAAPDATGVASDAHNSSTALLLTDDGNLLTIELDHGLHAVDLTRPSATARRGASTRAVDGATRPIGADALTRFRALGLALTSADLVGVMRGALDLACDYAKERRQYGTAIGSFQAVQHLLADAAVAVEGSHSVALHAAWAVDKLAPDDALAAGAVAKAYCARAARDVCETVIQVFGGLGNTWDCLAHVYLRRALVSIDLFGGVGPNLDRVLAHHAIGVDGGLR
jgi:alkylation response protein AidB-like acyl-CoA dehydrogenase